MPSIRDASTTSRWAFVALFVWLFFPSHDVSGAMLYTYDLDSLVFMSSDVVEAELIRHYRADNLSLTDFKITAVHKGGFQKGQTVAVAATYFYRKPDPKFTLNNVDLAAGENMFLFLGPARSSFAFEIPKGAAIYVTVPSGMRLMVEGRAVGFSQQSNPGPYVAHMPSLNTPKDKLPTVERFREQVGAALLMTKQFAADLEKKTQPSDAPWMIEFLKGRSTPADFGFRDHLAELACMRLANWHEPDRLAVALPIVGSNYGRSILYRGFGTVEGREFLLSKVADEQAPMAKRVEYARILGSAGYVYRSRFTENTSNSWRPVGDADEGNSGYTTRIARLAKANHRDQELCVALVQCVDRFAQSIVQTQEAQTKKDLIDAIVELQACYRATDSEQIKYAIEGVAARSDRKLYDGLQSPCGPVITILSPVDPKMYGKPAAGSLIYYYSCNTSLLPEGVVLKPFVVLVHQESKKAFVVPSDTEIRSRISGGGSRTVTLPSGLPAGKYRIFWRFVEGEMVISNGHYFETDL